MCRWMSTPSSVFAREAFLDEVAQALGFACNIFEGGTATAYQMEVSNRTDKGGMPFQIHGVVAAVDCGAGAAPAVAGALFTPTGRRFRSLPIRSLPIRSLQQGI